MKKIIAVFFLVLTLLAPGQIFAQSPGTIDSRIDNRTGAIVPASAFSYSSCSSTLRTLSDLACFAVDIFNRAITPLIFSAALGYFLYGVFVYIQKGATDPKAHADGMKQMMYGIIGLAVMLSVWALVNVLVSTFRFSNNTTPTIPRFR